MKLLVGAACIVIIAAGGYYLYDSLATESCEDIGARLAAAETEYEALPPAAAARGDLLQQLDTALDPARVALLDDIDTLTAALEDCR